MKKLFNGLRFRILAAVMIVMFFAVAILIFSTYVKLKNDIIKKNEESLKLFSIIFESEKDLLIKKYSMALDVLLENPLVTEAFARRDRNTLADLVTPIYNTRLKHLYNIEQFQFHLPPAVSFYRAHIPNNYGDNLEAFRKTVIRANETKSTVSGIEVGRGGLGLRVVKPVWYNFDSVGTVEFGGNVESILETTRACTGINYGIGVFKSVLTNARFLDDPTKWMQYDDMFVYGFSEDIVRKLTISGDIENRDIIHDGGRYYITRKLPLYDFSSEQIGYLVVVRDTTKDVAGMRSELLRQGSIIAAYGFFAVIIMSSFLIRLIFRPLEMITNHLSENEITLDKEPAELVVSDNAELSVLTGAYNTLNKKLYNNLKQIDEQMKEIQSINSTLEENVKKRTQELETTNEKLEKALENYKNINEAKSEFLADMSHEIRTPMNAIIGLSYLAMQTQLNAKQYGYLNKIHTSANMMLEIINDILDFSKIEAGRLELENVNFSLYDLMKKIEDILEVQAEKKKITFDVDISEDTPRFVKGDPLRLSQVLNNLGANAVKYTETGGVTLSVESVESNMAYTTLKFTVKDTGIGIPKEKLNLLFTSYGQISSKMARKYGGSGLGLNITKKILDKMGGTIFVESVPDKGSTFWFTIKLKNVDITKVEDFSEKTKLLKGKRVLVGEKYSNEPGSISSIYREFMANVTSADSQVSMLKILSSNIQKDSVDFDLIVVEHVMNDVCMLSAVESLRQIAGEIKLPPVIFISNEDTPPMDGINLIKLMKPADPGTLFNATIRLITGKDYKDEINISVNADTSGAGILIVDDNSLNREVAADFMEILGLTADYAENGLEAVRMAEKKVYDVIFMDIMMPNLDGYAASKMIRQSGLNTDTPIYAMTASVIDEDNMKLKSSMISGSISKPFKLNEITKAITDSVMIKNFDAGSPLLHDVSGHVDFQTGIANFGGNMLLYKKAVSDFIQFCGDTETLLANMIQSDPDNIRSFLLQMQSFSENLALTPLADIAGTIYRKMSTNSPADINKEYANLKETLKKTVSILNRNIT